MKPNTETIITALRSGLATKAELAEHHGCGPGDLRKPIDNMQRRNLITRYMEGGGAAYKLTDAGKKWKPTRQKEPTESEGGETDVRSADDAMPEPDAKLLAIANQWMAKQLKAIRVAMGDEMMRPEDIPGRIRELSQDVDLLRQNYASSQERADKFQREAANLDALVAKLQSLLNTRQHEIDGLRAQLAVSECCGNCAPDLETVPLSGLVEHVATFLDSGQSITIHAGDVVTINAFGRQFVGNPSDSNALLDASATLIRAEVAE